MAAVLGTMMSTHQRRERIPRIERGVKITKTTGIVYALHLLLVALGGVVTRSKR
jgi:hypothetical protein